MPYITPDDRDYLHLPDATAENAGQLNYQIFTLLFRYMRLHGRSYKTYAEMAGVLAHVQLELYRRSTVPYEDRKQLENGDIFPYELTK